jgi:hypothetical protein
VGCAAAVQDADADVVLVHDAADGIVAADLPAIAILPGG